MFQKNEFFGPNDTGKTHVILIRRKNLKHSKGKSTQVKLIFAHFFDILAKLCTVTIIAPFRVLVQKIFQLNRQSICWDSHR